MKSLLIYILILGSILTGCTAPPLPSSPDAAPLPAGGPTNAPFIPAGSVTPTPVAMAKPGQAFPSQPEGIPYPTQSWPKGDWPAGVDKSSVDEAVELAFAGGGAKRMRAVVVIHAGELIYERYSQNRDDGPAKVMPSYSLAKSFTSALVGILVRDGLLDVNAPVAVPAWSSHGDRRAGITLDDLLRMSSGLRWSGARYPDPAADLTQMLASDDAAAYAAGRKLMYTPGTYFAYNEGNTMLVNRIQADLVGSGHAFRKFMEDELLYTIGIRRMDMMFDPAGTWFGAISADTTAANYARFGLLFLRDGVWEGERILPEGWVEYSRTPSVSNPEYGAGWWLDLERPGVFYAVGIHGQTIAVDPQHDLTFVTLATDSQVSLPVSEAILDAFAAKQ